MRKHLAIAAVCATVLAGCGGGGKAAKQAADPGTTKPAAVPETATTSATSASNAPSAQKYDPPVKFATTPSTTIPVDQDYDPLDTASITLSAQTAYVSDPGALRAVSLTSGQVLWHVTPKNQAVTLKGHIGAPPPAAPVLSRSADGTSTVFQAFAVTVPGQGTTADQSAVELWAINAATGAALWNETLPQTDPAFNGGEWSATVVGTDATSVLIQADGVHGATSFAVSTATHKVLWTKNLFDAFALLHDTAVGIQVPDDQTNIGAPETGKLAGVDEATGSQLWSRPDKLNRPTVAVAGSDLVSVDGDVDGTQQQQFVDAHSGAVVSTAASPLPKCMFDGASVTVCASPVSASAYDSTSGKLLWTLPDQATNRKAPTVTAVWHGAVYGNVGHSQVVLDARTGADRQDAPGIAPYAVDEYVGLDLPGPPGTGSSGVGIYPATG